MTRLNARKGSARTKYRKMREMYDYIAGIIAMTLDCPAGDLEQCSQDEFFTFLAGLVRRVHQDGSMRIYGFFSSLLGVDPCISMKKFMVHLLRHVSRSVRRSFQRRWKALHLAAAIGCDFFPSEYFFTKELVTLGGELVRSVRKANSCYGETGATLDVPTLLDELHRYVRPLMIVQPQPSTLVLSWPNRQEAPSEMEVKAALEQMAAAAPAFFEGVDMLQPHDADGRSVDEWRVANVITASMLLVDRSPDDPMPITTFTGDDGTEARAEVALFPTWHDVDGGSLETEAGAHGRLVRWLFSGHDALVTAGAPPRFDVGQLVIVPIMVGADGCKELRVVGRGTPERGMLTNVMVHAHLAYLAESDATWHIVGQLDGDDSHANFKCFDDSVGFSESLIRISEDLRRDPFPDVPFAFEARAVRSSGMHRWIRHEFSWVVDGKANVNFAGRGGWTDASPCSQCDCPIDDLMNDKCGDVVEWSTRYKQAIYDAIVAAESDSYGDSSLDLNIISAGTLADLFVHVESFTFKTAKVQHTLHVAAQRLPGALEMAKTAATLAKADPTADATIAACQTAVDALAQFRSNAPKIAIPLDVGGSGKKALKDLRESLHSLHNGLELCVSSSSASGMTPGLEHRAATSAALFTQALQARFYDTSSTGIAFEGWEAAASRFVTKAVQMRDELAVRSFFLSKPPSSLSDDLQLLCTRMDEFIESAVGLLGPVDVVDADGDGGGATNGDGDAGNGDAGNDEADRDGSEVCNLEFSQLSGPQKRAATGLGFTGATWDANDWSKVTTTWSDLRSTGGDPWDWAQALQFDATTWLGGRPPHTLSWAELTDAHRAAAKRLGFKTTTWNDDSWSAIRFTWVQLQLQSSMRAAAAALSFSEATWHGGGAVGDAANSLNSTLDLWGVEGYTSQFKEPRDAAGARNLLLGFFKLYDELLGLKHSCAFVGGRWPCLSLLDLLHALQLRTALSSFYDKAAFPLLYAISSTDEGKKLWTGDNKNYAGLQGAGTPTSCVTTLFAKTKPNVQTQECHHQPKGQHRLCLKQPTSHVWFDVLAERSAEFWRCFPPSDGYDVMSSHAHAMLVFIVSLLSSQVPLWGFGLTREEDMGCDELANELEFVVDEFRLVMRSLVPPRKTPSGRWVTWLVTSPHSVFNHLVPFFRKTCGTELHGAYFNLAGLEVKHARSKHARHDRSSSATSTVSKTHNKATLAQKELVYSDMYVWQTEELFKNADNAVATGQGDSEAQEGVYFGHGGGYSCKKVSHTRTPCYHRRDRGRELRQGHQARQAVSAA